MNRSLLLGLVLPASVLLAEPPATPDPKQLEAPGSEVKLPGMVIHGGDQKSIAVEGRASLTGGILEFLAVEPGGRDYESLFTLHCKPSALQFALLLIGCEPGPLPRLAKDGEKPGDQIVIEAEWLQDGKPTRAAIHELLIDRKTHKAPGPLEWFFTGSYFAKSVNGTGEVYMSDSEQAHIALWWTKSVLINLGGEHGNPYQADDQGFEVNPKRMPPKDTAVKLIFRKAK